MKIDFNVKLLIGLLAVFAVVIGIFIFYEPVKVKILAWKLESADNSTRENAIAELLKCGERGNKILINYFERRYPVAEVDERIKIVETMCAMGDEAKASLKTMFIARCRKEMVPIPAGEFMMGSERGWGNELPVHKVTLSAFAMDKYEVSNEKYFTFDCLKGKNKNYLSWVKSNSIYAGFRDNPLCPMVGVNWYDAKAYADWTHMKLPSEAQWEYACRAGSTSEWFFQSEKTLLDDYAWYVLNSQGKTHPCGEKKPNQWGLYDILGNACEWCRDWYEKEYNSQRPLNNPLGPETGIHRVLRGSSWSHGKTDCCSAFRDSCFPELSNETIGFRVCVSPEP